MGRRLVAQLLAVLVAAVVAFLVVAAARGREPEPRLLFVQDVPADVRRASDATFERFLHRFAGRVGCVDDVSVELVRAVEDGDARYVAGRRRIEIQIPTTPARYEESLAHELAHHLERTCGEFESLRSVLEPMLGGDGVPWSGGPIWEEIPSERFAEAVVELVNGERIRHTDTVVVEPAAREVIARWGTGEQLVVDR